MYAYLVIFLFCGMPGLCRSVLSMMVEKLRIKAASADAKGRPWPRNWNRCPAKASMRRSMHCASPGSLNEPRNRRSARSKAAFSPDWAMNTQSVRTRWKFIP